MKIKLKSKLISLDTSFEIETMGILQDNKITYKENDIIVIITILDDKIEMKRTNNKYEVSFLFEENKKTLGNYYLKDLDKSFDIMLYTKKLIINKEEIIIEYIIEENSFNYSLKTGG